MKKIIVTFEFDEKKVGKNWLNKYNLELMMYSKHYTKREILKCIIIKDEK